MVKTITIDLAVPEGVHLVSYAREIHPSQENVSTLMFVLSMEARRQKEDSNSVPMATGLIFAMTTHPPYPICLRQVANAWPLKASNLICRKLGFPTEGSLLPQF